MRFVPLYLLAVIALNACGFAHLEEPLDPVPEGELSFLVEEGTYDAHYETVSTTCPDVEPADLRWSTQVTSGVDGTPTFYFEGPSTFLGWGGWTSVADSHYVHTNPTITMARTEVPETIEVVETLWVERAGPGFLELRIESDFTHAACERVATVSLTLRR